MREARHTVSVALSDADGAVNPRITRIGTDYANCIDRIRVISGLRNLRVFLSLPLGGSRRGQVPVKVYH